MKINKIKSIGELNFRCQDDGPKGEPYRQLALIGARNLGGEPTKDWRKAIQWIQLNAMETDEAGVVDEINFIRDLV